MQKLFLIVFILSLVIQEYVFETVILKNKDIAETTPEVARQHGYVAETHRVVTEDGFILGNHRIFKNSAIGKQPVFLQHGFLDNSNDWVNAVNVSLAFLLADEGFDVWIGNSRGNSYSKGHVKYFESNPQYYNYSFEEMGIYDVKDSINYILNETNSKDGLLYVGHSQGCNSFYVYASVFPELAAKSVKAAFTLAPAVFLGEASAYIKYPATLLEKNKWIFKALGVTHIDLLDIAEVVAYHCEDTKYSMEFCRIISQILFGFDGMEIDDDVYPVIYAHFGACAAVKEGLHLIQIIETNQFKMYDYGHFKNIKVYGTSTPPRYQLGNVKVPTYIYYGENDSVVKGKDAQKLANRLPNNKLFKEIKNFNHIDFLYSRHVRNLVYNNIVDVFKSYESKSSSVKTGKSKEKKKTN